MLARVCAELSRQAWERAAQQTSPHAAAACHAQPRLPALPPAPPPPGHARSSGLSPACLRNCCAARARRSASSLALPVSSLPSFFSCSRRSAFSLRLPGGGWGGPRAGGWMTSAASVSWRHGSRVGGWQHHSAWKGHSIKLEPQPSAPALRLLLLASLLLLALPLLLLLLRGAGGGRGRGRREARSGQQAHPISTAPSMAARAARPPGGQLRPHTAESPQPARTRMRCSSASRSASS